MVKSIKKKYINQSDFRQLFSWYAFLSTGPRIVIGMGITFFLFILFYVRFPVFFRRTFKLQNTETVLTFLLLLTGIGSWYFATHPSETLRATISFVYWQISLLFFFNNRNFLPWKLILKMVSWGMIATIIHRFFLSPFIPRQPFLYGYGENGFGFMLICYAPIILLYIRQNFHKNVIYLSVILLFLAGIMNGSRAGFGILGIQLAIMLYILNFKRLSFFFVIIVFAGITLFFQFKIEIGEQLSKLNPGYGELLLDEDIFKKDLSYLIRLAQQKKSIALFEENPYFGVGLMNFTKQDYKFKDDFEGAFNVIYKGYIDKMETHNSYLTILTELGGIAFVFFISIILITLIKYIRKLGKKQFAIHAFFISFLGMLTHFYLVNSIVNSFVWFTLGLIIAFINRSPKLKTI